MLLFSFAVINMFQEEGSEAMITQGSSREKIAVVELFGVIRNSDDIVRQLRKYGERRDVNAIVLRIDSPGGAVAPSQEIYEAVKSIRDAGKTVVVSMGSVAASGGYYAACAANRIVANRGTITGSIGVISQFFRLDPMLEKVGVESNTIKSGKHKDVGNPFRKMTKEDRQYFQDLMDDIHRQFITAVEQERHLDHKNALRLADGGVFTGEHAVLNGLVDTLGTYEDAIHIAADLSGIRGEPTVIRERKSRPLFQRLFGESSVLNLWGLKDEILSPPILEYRFIHFN